jgi:hypothetical protein
MNECAHIQYITENFRLAYWFEILASYYHIASDFGLSISLILKIVFFVV